MLASQFRLPGERKKNSADCTMNEKTTNIYFPVLVIIIVLVKTIKYSSCSQFNSIFVADHKSAMVKLCGKKKKREIVGSFNGIPKTCRLEMAFWTAVTQPL